MSAKVNVLDTTYTINKIKEQDKFMIENNLCGYCDFYEKKIVVLASDTTSKKELHEIERHEFIHAFLYECGLNDSSDWARNEELIDWLAIQLPKINVLFEKAGVTS